MPEQIVKNLNINVDINELVRRQDELERELSRLREMYREMKENNSHTIGRVHQRIDQLEEEIEEVRNTLNELMASVNLIQTGVTHVQKHVSDINAKQDIAITAQDKFIGQLWKAFFALLGVTVTIGGALVAYLK